MPWHRPQNKFVKYCITKKTLCIIDVIQALLRVMTLSTAVTVYCNIIALDFCC